MTFALAWDADQPLLRITGLVGVAAAALMVVADLVMLYAPHRSSALRVAELAPSLSRGRILTGDYLGLVSLPFVLTGLVHMYLGLRPAGPWLALPPVLLLVYAYVLRAAFHHLVALLLRLAQQNHGAPAPGMPGGTWVLAEFLLPLYGVFMVTALLGSAWLFLALVGGHTHYPRWAALLSPAITGGLALLGRRVAPPELAGVLTPAGPNLAMFIFLALSTILLWA